MMAVFKAILALAVVWTVYFLRGNVWFRLYPAVVCAAVLAAFALSAFKTPLVEAIARRRGEVLDEEGIAYCRKVNKCWIAFLGVHFLLTVASIFAPIGVWAFYNGFLAYVLIASMFAGEWLYRRKVKGSRR